MEHFFYIRFSKLGERFDPSVYRARFKYISKIFPNVKLNEIAYIDPATYFDKYPRDMQISFVPMDSINATYGTIETQQTIAISQSKGYTRFQEGDLLWAKITPCMQNGKSAIAHNLVNGFGCGSTEFFVIRPKNSQIVLSEYLYILLRNEKVLQGAMNFFGGSAGQQRVSPIFLRDFIIPLPDVAVQRDIIARYFRALTLKRQQEQEADRLIQSIDDYILSELGIERPERTENGRFFYTSFREIEGKRIDPYYNHPYFKKAYNSLHKTPYPVLRLGELSTLIASGSTPPSGGEDYTTKENGIMFVRSGDITNDCNIIDSSDMLYITKECHNTKMRQSQLRYGDILIAIVGATIGAVNIYNYNAEANINQAIALVRLKSGINELFITEQLRSSIGRLNLEHQKRPVARANINLDEIAQMELILPPLEIQDKIAENIQSIRDQAKYLQQEAKEIINNAKQKIEQMILGK